MISPGIGAKQKIVSNYHPDLVYWQTSPVPRMQSWQMKVLIVGIPEALCKCNDIMSKKWGEIDLPLQ